MTDIATSLKAFKLDGRFDVICSGSLLGINYKKIHSNSVGYKTDYEMFSMDFEEFLWAKGYSDLHIEQILEHMCSGKAFSDTELSVYKKLFLEYCVLGGMPAVIRQYIETNTFSDTLEIQHQIQFDYEEDIRKYAEQKKADWILNGGIEKEWDSYLKKMEQYGLSDYLAIKQKYFDKYQESLKSEQGKE